MKRLNDSNDCARSKACNFAKIIYKLKENDRATIYSPAMHVVSLRDLHSAELEDLEDIKVSTVMTANGNVQTREEATVHVKELDFFLTVILPPETPAVLSLEALLRIWLQVPSDQRSKTTSHQKGKRIDGNISNYVSFVVPRKSTSSLRRPHLLPHHLHHKILHLTSTGHTENSVPERSRSTSGGVSEKPAAEPNRNRKQNKRRKDAKKCKATSCMTCWAGYRNSEKLVD